PRYRAGGRRRRHWRLCRGPAPGAGYVDRRGWDRAVRRAGAARGAGADVPARCRPGPARRAHGASRPRARGRNHRQGARLLRRPHPGHRLPFAQSRQSPRHGLAHCRAWAGRGAASSAQAGCRMKALLAFLPLFRQRGRAFGLALLLSLVTLLAGVALLGTSGWFITATALTTLGLGFNLFVPSSLVRGFSFIRILARYGERLVGHNATLKLLSDLRGWLFALLFPKLPLPDRSLRHGDLVSRLTADVDALDTAFLVAIGPWMAALLVGGGMTALLGFFLPGAALAYGLAML